jgi:hypothetical protein
MTMAGGSTHDRGGAIGRLYRAAQLLRPRTLAQLGKTDARLQQQIHLLTQEVQALKAQLNQVARQERQLRALFESDYDANDQIARFATLIRESPIKEHVRSAVAGARLEDDPFPHCVIDDLLPAEYYDTLIAGLPPVDLFADRPVNKQQLTVPLEHAPRYATEVWRHMARVVAEGIIKPAVLAKFHEPLTRWLRDQLPILGERPLDGLRITCSDGRILLRRPGYLIPPHRDPKWGFITCLMYLARKGDDERWGTQLFRVTDDNEAEGARPHWISDAQCQLAGEVAFRPNRVLVFLNSVGAHGAHIPPDAQPATLERYAYQFRLGADGRSIKSIQAQLTPEQRAFWAGKAGGGYAGGRT